MVRKKNFSEFLKNRNVEFSGNIGKDFIRTGKERAVIPVDTSNLSDRLKRILYSEKVFDLGKLSTYYEEDIMNFHGLGVTGYQELFSVLKEYGIHPVSYMKETKELKFFYRWEKRELYENNIRTLEDVYALSEARKSIHLMQIGRDKHSLNIFYYVILY